MQSVSAGESIGLKQIRDGNFSAGVITLLGADVYKVLVVSPVSSQVQKEVRLYVSNSTNMLCQTKAEQLRNFNLSKVATELDEEMPTVCGVVRAICQRKHQGKLKTHEAIKPAITSILCKCLGVYSERMSAYKYVLSSVLMSGGTKQCTLNQLACVHDVMSNTQRDRKQLEYVQLFDQDLQVWKDEENKFQIVFDNVDKHVKRRHQSSAKPNAFQHMVQAIALKDRVVTTNLNLPPAKPIGDFIDPTLLFPSEEDCQVLVEGLSSLIRNIWAEHIPALEWMRPEQDLRHIYSHKFQDEMKQKSELVNIVLCFF